MYMKLNIDSKNKPWRHKLGITPKSVPEVNYLLTEEQLKELLVLRLFASHKLYSSYTWEELKTIVGSLHPKNEPTSYPHDIMHNVRFCIGCGRVYEGGLTDTFVFAGCGSCLAYGQEIPIKNTINSKSTFYVYCKTMQSHLVDWFISRIGDMQIKIKVRL